VTEILSCPIIVQGIGRINVYLMKLSCKGQVGDLRLMLMSIPNFNIHMFMLGIFHL